MATTDDVGLRLESKRVRAAGAAGGVGGQRLLAAEAIGSGEYILTLTGEMLPSPTQYSVQVGVGVHVNPPRYHGDDPQADPHIWRNLNHSCDANARLIGARLLALRSINAGDEITFNYNTTEFEMASAFTCGCGVCGGSSVAGFKHLSPARRRELWPLVGEHVRILAREAGISAE